MNRSTRASRRRSAGGRTTAIYAAVVLALVSSACASTASELQIGVKRTAIDLAFKDESLPDKEPLIRRIVQEIEGPRPSLSVIDIPEPEFRRPSLPAFELCPKAPAGSAPAQAVTVTITQPPKPGKYTYINEGSVRIGTPILEVTLPYPPILQREVTNIRKNVPILTPVGTQSAVAPWAYDVVVKIGSASVTATYHLMSDGIYLANLTRVTQGNTRSFTPHEPAQIYGFGAQGDDWDAKVMDLPTRTVGIFDGFIADRKIVDLCGTVVDTFMATTAEEIVDLDGDYRSRTDTDDPNRFHYATHIGPLPVAEHIHYTENIQVEGPEGAPIPIEVEWNYDTRLASLEPRPLDAK